MEIINKRNKKVQTLNDAKSAYISFNLRTGRINFNAACCETARLMLGNYVHLVNMDKLWFFFSNDDPSGYKLWKPEKDQDYLSACSMPLMRYFMESTGFKEPVKFFIQKSNAEVKGHKLFEIVTSIPLHTRSNKKNIYITKQNLR